MSNETWTDSDINWDDVSTEAPAPLEPSLYNAKIVATEVRTSKANNLCINCEVSVTRTFQGDELGSPKKHYTTLVFVAGGAFKVKQAAQAAGQMEALPKRATEESVKGLADALLGAEVIVKTKHEPHPKDKSRMMSVIDRFFTVEQAEAHKAGKEPDAAAPAAVPVGRKARKAG